MSSNISTQFSNIQLDIRFSQIFGAAEENQSIETVCFAGKQLQLGMDLPSKNKCASDLCRTLTKTEN